jgi:hypothetical protein
MEKEIQLKDGSKVQIKEVGSAVVVRKGKDEFSFYNLEFDEVVEIVRKSQSFSDAVTKLQNEEVYQMKLAEDRWTDNFGYPFSYP